MDLRLTLIETMRLLWRHRIAAICAALAGSIILTMLTTAKEPKAQLIYNLVVNNDVANAGNVFQFVANNREVRNHVDDVDGDGSKWRINIRRNTVYISSVTSTNEMAVKKVMHNALQNALQRLNTYSLDVIKTAELSRSTTLGGASEFGRDVLRAKLFNRYFENDQKMIAYYNIQLKDGLAIPVWLSVLMYFLLSLGLVAFCMAGRAVWLSKMPEFLEFFKTEIANERA